MAKVINAVIPDKYKELQQINVDDFFIVGYKLSSDKDSIDFYYIVTDKDDKYLLKQSYLIDKENRATDMAYFNHPLHMNLFIDRYGSDGFEDMRASVTKLIEEFDHTNSYYCDFKAVNKIGNYTMCNCIKKEVSGDVYIKRIILPDGIYYKEEAIKNCIVFKTPINPSIDTDKSYDDMKIYNDISIKFFGYQVVDDETAGKNILAFYSMNLDSPLVDNITHVGVGVPVIALQKGIFSSHTTTIENFVDLYHINFVANVSNYMIVQVLEEDEIAYKFALCKLLGNKRYLFITNESPDDSILFNPYKCIYNLSETGE